MTEAVARVTGRQAPVDVETPTASGERVLPAVQRALTTFLALPVSIIISFVVTGILVYAVERANPAWIQALRSAIQDHLFADSQTTGDFLGTVAGGLLTQASIVISMLLIVLQQTASNMGNLVYDQFMARRHNQIYVGYVIGTIVLALFFQSTVSDSFNPVLGGTLVLVLTFISVGLLAWFLYTTMTQMKPEVIVSDIHSSAMHARESDLRRLWRTRRESISPAEVLVTLRSTTRGYVTAVNLDKIDECLQGRDPATEIVIHAIVGDFVSYRDVIAEVRSGDLEEARAVGEGIGQAFTLAREREPASDSRFNLEQLEMVAWTEGSSSKHNPETALMVTHTLRDLLRRWVLKDLTPDDVEERIAVVYPDRLIDRALDVFESLAVVSTESKQYQLFAEVLEALALTYRDLPPGLRRRVDSLLCRVVPGLQEHLYTFRIEAALDHIVFALRDVGNDETAEMLARARNQLASTMGQLSSGGGSGGSGGGSGNRS